MLFRYSPEIYNENALASRYKQFKDEYNFPIQFQYAQASF